MARPVMWVFRLAPALLVCTLLVNGQTLGSTNGTDTNGTGLSNTTHLTNTSLVIEPTNQLTYDLTAGTANITAVVLYADQAYASCVYPISVSC